MSECDQVMKRLTGRGDCLSICIGSRHRANNNKGKHQCSAIPLQRCYRELDKGANYILTSQRLRDDHTVSIGRLDILEKETCNYYNARRNSVYVHISWIQLHSVNQTPIYVTGMMYSLH